MEPISRGPAAVIGLAAAIVFYKNCDKILSAALGALHDLAQIYAVSEIQDKPRKEDILI